MKRIALGHPDVAAVVLAAGLGTRLRPLTDLLPKPLCPVGNVPLVDLAVARVRASTPDVAVNVHHHRHRMESHLSTLGVHVSVEEQVPLGTAGAIGRLREWIDGRAALVHNADAWMPTGAAPDLVEGWDRERIRLLVVPARPGLEDFGQWTFAGISLMPWAAVTRLEPEPTGLWEVLWRREVERDRVEFVVFEGAWFDTGTPTRYLAANLAASGGVSVVAPDAFVDDRAEVVRSVVWSGARVEAGERLVEQVRAPGPLTVDGGGP